MPKSKEQDIDYTDIAATDEQFWENAIVNVPRKKQLLTLRLDAEVIEWFKEHGRGYQTQINAVLKTYMQKTMGRKSAPSRVTRTD